MENKEPRIPQKSGIGFRYAWKGIRHLFKTQLNARIHLTIAVFVIASGAFLGLSNMEWMIVVICIGMVFAAELFNSAIEYLTDLVSPEFNKKAGLVKDMSAGAVLIAAMASAIAGLWIFVPKLFEFTCTLFGPC